jgi:Tfp pilus assembly PilM family ATPase
MINCNVLFWKTNNLVFIELGNFYVKSSCVQKKLNKCEVISQVILPNISYKDGVIRDKECFASTISQAVKQHGCDYKSIVVGLNSSYIIHNGFESKQNVCLEHLNSLIPDNKIIHHKTYANQISTLSIHRTLLNKIYSNFQSLSTVPIKFIATSYLEALPIKKDGMTLIINIGYRSTTATVFDGDFLIFYKTLSLGIENLLIPIKQKFDISILDSIDLIKNINLNNPDNRQWATCGDKSFNSEKVVDVISFYLEAFINKILQNNIGSNAKNVIISGWGTLIQGADLIFKKYLNNVNIAPHLNYLDSHAKIQNYLFDI